MKTSVNYLGLELQSPLISSASPISSSVALCQELEGAGVGAITMHSLFEEEINSELHEVDAALFAKKESFSEALGFFPQMEFENYETENYFKQLRALKTSLDIPVIASLNGVSSGGWVKYAQELEREGADALELNLYFPVTQNVHNSMQIEALYVETVKAVCALVNIPVAVKISAYVTALPHLCHALFDAGAKAVTLFNRFYQSDINLEALQWESTYYESSPYDFTRMLRSLAIVYGHEQLQYCASGGVQHGTDIIKATMAGATAVSSATTFLKEGALSAKRMLDEANTWMEQNEYESFDQMRGSISLQKAPNPSVLERYNYVRLLHRATLDDFAH